MVGGKGVSAKIMSEKSVREIEHAIFRDMDSGEITRAKAWRLLAHLTQIKEERRGAYPMSPMGQTCGTASNL